MPVSTAEKQGAGQALGTVKIVETPYGLAFHPDLKGLPAGLHGFHIQEKPSCAPAEANGATWATCRRCTSAPTAMPLRPCSVPASSWPT